MEAVLSFTSSHPSSQLHHYHNTSSYSSSSSSIIKVVKPINLLGLSCIPKYPLHFMLSSCRARNHFLRPPYALVIDDEVLEKSLAEEENEEHTSHQSSSIGRERDMLPKIDKNGRFCSPRSARELALSILYAACLEGSDPISHFERRLNARKEIGYEFEKNYLSDYNHMSFGGPPVHVDSSEEADELQRLDDNESHIESEVLSAPPKLVYSKLILRFTRKLLVAVVEKWDNHVLDIDKIAPPNWKLEPASRILEFSILHLAMSEIDLLGTRHQIVINEAVDLAKRFCDGAAPRIINGCLRSFVKNLKARNDVEESKAGNGIIS